MAQPAFWLKVNKDYVIENFEALLVYLRNYDYNPTFKDGNTDFDDSCRCLMEVADDLSERVANYAMWETPDLGVSHDKGVRILAAAVLTERKRGKQGHVKILELIRLLLLVNQTIPADSLKKLFNLALSCICRTRITSFPVSFNSIIEDNFSIAAFCSLLAASVCETSDSELRLAFEKNGAAFIRSGKLILAPMNLADAAKARLRRELSFDSAVEICDSDPEKLDSEEKIMAFYPRLYSMLQSVKPSPEQTLWKYRDGHRMSAEITYVNDSKIYVRTCDPQYEQINGRIYLDNDILRIPRECLTRMLHTGDRINVIYHEDTLYPFNLDYDSLNDFISEYSRDFQGETVSAIFYEEFKSGKGTRWLTEDGVFVNIIGSFDSLPEYAKEAVSNDFPVSVKIDYVRTDNKGNNVVNGSFNPDHPISFGDDFSSERFQDLAFDSLLSEFIDSMQPADIQNTRFHMSPVAYPRMKAADLCLIGRLLGSMARDEDSTFDNMATLTIAMAATEISGHSADADFIRHNLDYLSQLVRFATGASPMSLHLTRPASLLDAEPARIRDRVVESLRIYRESEMTHAEAFGDNVTLGKKEEDLPDTVGQLVRASNILSDKIDSSEINRIKKSIAAKLGVADVYRDIFKYLPYFGVESETLEFKRSCCFAPAGKRSGSLVKDIETQRWNIMRTICGFLNSQLGGDLLIGVTDSGYACGLIPDIDCLAGAGMISERSADRLRTYLKYEIDKAFETLDGSARGRAITSEFVHCNIENPAAHIDILRIRIDPYPWDVVKLTDEGRPENIAAVYRRASGSTVPMDKDGIRNIKLAKIKAIDRVDMRIAQLMQAIDEEKMVRLRGYSSRKGKVDRRIEPHRIFHAHKAVQAFDVESKSMKLFRLSRVDSVDIMTEKWKYTSHHKDYAVDVFGMMETPSDPAEKVKLRMTDYAYSLLTEEFPVKGGDSFFAQKEKYSGCRQSWIVEIETFHPAGLARFILSLPNETEVIEGERLSEYLEEKTANRDIVFT